jgi:hypothetical protein
MHFSPMGLRKFWDIGNGCCEQPFPESHLHMFGMKI